MEIFERRNLLLSDKQIEKIENAKIALFGLGGVGGFTFDSLLRIGIKNFLLCDGDAFSLSNLNRQILSNINNIGINKAVCAKTYALNINKDVNIIVCPFFLNEETFKVIDLKDYFIVDAIDDVKAKILLAEYAYKNGNKIISMMGAGNRLHADFVSKDIFKTANDPLSKKMRTELKKRNIPRLKVVYTESSRIETNSTTIGSISYIVGKAGLKLAEEVISDIIQ